MRDLLFAWRLLGREADVSALIVLVLALGIGGNSATFTLLKATFLDPLPYRDADRLVVVREDSGWSPSVGEFIEIRKRGRELEQPAFLQLQDMQLTGPDEPVRILAGRVTASFFPLLGVSASKGRTFSAEDNLPGANPVVMVSDGFWHSGMGADPGIIGRTLRLDGKPFQIVGVLPPAFHFDYPTLGVPEPIGVYVAFPLERSYSVRPSGYGGGPTVRMLARMRDGSTFQQAEAELRSIGSALVTENPSEFRRPDGKTMGVSFTIQPLREAIVGAQRPLLWLLSGGVCVLLLIACANTAQLLVARGLRRGREVAIRAALGATRPRLIRQFLMEGLVLAICGGVLGLLLSVWIVRLLVRMLPARSPIFESARVDAWVITFTLGLSVFSALLFAIIPAVKGSMYALGPSLGSRAIGQGNRWRHGMLALEAALSVFLLCGAGLIGQNLLNLLVTPAGFDGSGVTLMQLALPPQRIEALPPSAKPWERTARAFEEYLERVQAIPGVEAAAISTAPPLLPQRGGPTRIVGVPVAGDPLGYPALTNMVSPDYFRTLGIPLIAGRAFRDDDAPGREPVVIVNQEFARRAGVENPVGMKEEPGLDAEHPTATIIGMVGNVRMRNLDPAPVPETYWSYRQVSLPTTYLAVRSSLPQAQLVNSVKQAIRSSYREQAVFNIRTMDQVFSSSVAQPRFQAALTGAFALLALAMAASGMYTVISYLVSQRTSEIAIRIALGAGRGAIVKTVLGTTSLWVVGGLAAGLGLGLAAGATIRSLTNTVTTGSPLMYAAVLAFFLLVTLLATCQPIRRAIRLDPAVALRSE
jgi:putative ABC transport system permease protein